MKKHIIFLVITMLTVTSIFASESGGPPPPGYNAGPYGEVVPSAPRATQPGNTFDPAREVLEKKSGGDTVHVVENSSCVCICPLNINVNIIPFLHGITTRLSLGLLGTSDSTTTEEINHADYVDQGPYLAVEDDASRNKTVEKDWEKKIA